MSLFGSSHNDEQSILLCTIESGAVHATLCLMNPHTKPFIVHSVTKQILFQEILNFERFGSATLQALADACQEVIRSGVSHVSSRRVRKGHIDAVYVTYGSPWYVSHTQHVDIQKAEPFLITEKTVDDLIAQYHAGDAPLTLSESTDTPKVLERTIIDIRLNGYPVHDPYNKEAQRISFSVIVGAIAQSIATYTEDVVGRFFSMEHFFHHAGPATMFLGIRDTLATDESFLALDVSGELTDVSVVRDGILTETVSFPHGVRTAMRLFAGAASLLPNEVLGVMQALKETKIDSNKVAVYERAAEKVRVQWQSAFTTAVLPTLEYTPLPRSIFILGDSGEFVRTKETLIPKTIVHPQTGEQLATTLILAEHLSPFCLIREGVRLGHPLVPLSALYVHRLLTIKKEK